MGSLEIVARIANPPEGLLAKYTRKEKEFFSDYAAFVLRQVTGPQVTEELRLLIDREQVNTGRMIDLRIMVFPARPLTGRPRNTLHGSYNQDSSQISLYPLKLPKEWIRNGGFNLFKMPKGELAELQEKILREIFTAAISTLIHEVLHVKFEDRHMPRYVEEAIVRKLERKYAEEWFDKLSRARPSSLHSNLPT